MCDRIKPDQIKVYFAMQILSATKTIFGCLQCEMIGLQVPCVVYNVQSAVCSVLWRFRSSKRMSQIQNLSQRLTFQKIYKKRN